MDSMDLYHHSRCTQVIRNYIRPDLANRVQVIPLGFATPPLTQPIPSWSSRSLVWSFHGTAWFHREAQLKPLLTVEPHSLHLTPGWKHPSATSPADWQTLLLESKFVPVPRGNHFETFRLYEALEHGAIPLYVRTEGDDVYWAWLVSHLSLEELKDWSEVPAFMARVPSSYPTKLFEQWAAWKEECRGCLLLHLALALRGLLHGRPELDVLVLALHLVINLLDETSPRSALASALALALGLLAPALATAFAAALTALLLLISACHFY